MKKTLLLTVALIATFFVAHATVYKFGTTSGGYTINQVVLTNLTAETTAITDTALVIYDYGPAASSATLSIPTIPNMEFSYTNSAVKTGIIKIYPNVLYTSGKNIVLTISNVTIGDSINIATLAKGATSDIWTVTGANTSSNLSIDNSKVSYIRLQATASTVILKETNGGFKILSVDWFTPVISAINPVLSDKGVSFNGTQILNNNGLALEVYNVLGKKVVSSMTSIPTANFQKGVYIVRVAGQNASLKICI